MGNETLGFIICDIVFTVCLPLYLIVEMIFNGQLMIIPKIFLKKNRLPPDSFFRKIFARKKKDAEAGNETSVELYYANVIPVLIVFPFEIAFWTVRLIDLFAIDFCEDIWLVAVHLAAVGITFLYEIIIIIIAHVLAAKIDRLKRKIPDIEYISGDTKEARMLNHYMNYVNKEQQIEEELSSQRKQKGKDAAKENDTVEKE